MSNTMDVWKPAALALLNKLAANNVKIETHHLYSYMDTVRTTNIF